MFGKIIYEQFSNLRQNNTPKILIKNINGFFTLKRIKNQFIINQNQSSICFE